MAEFATTPPIPYVPIEDQAALVRSKIDAAQLSAANSFGGLQKLAIPGPFATDAEANTFGVPDDNLYYRSDGTVRAASHISLDLAFALDKTLTARKGPTPAFTRSSTATFVGSNGLIQSAIIDAPRFDHDPITGICKGLLIEETRTNLVFPSETLTTQTRTVTSVAHTLSFYGTGTVVLSGVHSATVVGTGVFPARTTLTFTPTAGSLTLTVTGTVQFAQLEAGAFPTSYIPTTSDTAARSADVCSIIGGDFSSFHNPNEFSALCDFSFLSTAAAGAMVPIALNQSGVNGVLLYKGTLSAGVSVYHVAANSALGSVSVNIRAKGAFAYDGDSTVGVFDGGSVSPETGSSSLTFVEMTIGRNRTGVHPMSGHIARIQYFRKRLPNAKLQTITTP